MSARILVLTLCTFFVSGAIIAQKEICKNTYVWDFTDEQGKQNQHTRLLTQEVEDALTQTSCRVLQRRNYAKLSEQIDNEDAIQTIEGMSSTISSELQSIKAETVVFGKVQMDFSGNIMLSVSFQNLLTKEILKSESLMLAGEEAHNVGKRRQKIAAFISHCVGEQVVSNAETTYWQKVQQLGTLEAYQTYLDKYPAGKYRSEAQAAVTDEAEWQDIQKDKKTKRKVKKLIAFTENVQRLRYEDARIQLEELLWKEKMYEEYKSHFPEGKHAEQVDAVYEEELYRGAVQHAGYFVPRYLANFPDGKYADKMDDLLWGTVLQDTATRRLSAKDYLQHFPHGKHAVEAKKYAAQ